ncbi:MAG: hypothetical protein COX62_03255 [Deltaproteobacteria bacterium CG_4_10_14_0_2_um_filter_43_8]|nr:MAG: hypothetical protein COV43_01130 [Deltaproteobacteria bacterium CG11_big_fil_rev_8_21_14_0_20_42_23]PJA21131.1 MAG: hypothetical protein COX62_03255 [Deltaproteobacteria bacterium CG_4_10_14_0_2_um_filter_43_8]PJC63546.1 MAG: hypothetical protein CO021_08860 [Deltaproteobacteria bacterium CG_4_9_14_0_2_um_filter_42_21]
MKNIFFFLPFLFFGITSAFAVTPLENALKQTVMFERTKDVDYIYSAKVKSEHWQIRLGDFPAEPLYFFIINGKEIAEFNDWPTINWKRSDVR